MTQIAPIFDPFLEPSPWVLVLGSSSFLVSVDLAQISAYPDLDVLVDLAQSSGNTVFSKLWARSTEMLIFGYGFIWARSTKM